MEKHLQNKVDKVQAELLKIEKKGHLPEVRISVGDGYLTINSSHRFKGFTRNVQATGGDPVLYELRIGDKSKLDTTQDNDKNYSSANEVSMLNFYR